MITLDYPKKPYRKNFEEILVANFLCMADIKDELISKFMLDILDELYYFTKQGIYDVYISKEEKDKLTGIPKNWRESSFIKPELVAEYGFGYPLIYDIIGLYILYDLNNPEIDKKIDNIINYISTHDFHSKISDGYGILIDGEYASGNKCHQAGLMSRIIWKISTHQNFYFLQNILHYIHQQERQDGLMI